MNYFTPTQERIAIVETASYNQQLLALRARRIAQQRMDYAYTIAQFNDNNNQQDNEEENDLNSPYLGSKPKITVYSDDEDYELDETFAPVPYQKGYWIHAQRNRAKQNKTLSSSTTVQKKTNAGNAKNTNINTNTNTKISNKKLPNLPNVNKPNPTHQTRYSYKYNSRPATKYSKPQQINQYGPSRKPYKPPQQPYGYQYRTNTNTNTNANKKKRGPPALM